VPRRLAEWFLTGAYVALAVPFVIAVAVLFAIDDVAVRALLAGPLAALTLAILAVATLKEIVKEK
jgi:hypothetical protein